MIHPRLAAVLAAAITAAALTTQPLTASAAVPARPAPVHGTTTGAVFVQTDDPRHNAVIAFDRGADGRLTRSANYSTGGKGAALDGAVVDPLASQGSLTLDRAHDLLYAVNGGSDTLTVFAVRGSLLQRLQVLPTHGDVPVSVSVSGSLVYVLNARSGGSISGYRVIGDHLIPLAGSTRSLGLVPNANPEFLQTPSQVAVTPDGSAVVVATKTHGKLLVFPLNGGRPSTSPVVTKSGTVPFALSFDRAGRLLVVDATGFATAYRVRPDGGVREVSSIGPTGQQAACWTVVVRGTLYAANAGSNTISSFGIRGGTLTIKQAVAAHTDGGPVDLAASRHGRYLYQLSGATGVIDEFRVDRDGTLTSIGTVDTGLGAASGHALEGIAAS